MAERVVLAPSGARLEEIPAEVRAVGRMVVLARGSDEIVVYAAEARHLCQLLIEWGYGPEESGCPHHLGRACGCFDAGVRAAREICR